MLYIWPGVAFSNVSMAVLVFRGWGGVEGGCLNTRPSMAVNKRSAVWPINYAFLALTAGGLSSGRGNEHSIRSSDSKDTQAGRWGDF